MHLDDLTPEQRAELRDAVRDMNNAGIPCSEELFVAQVNELSAEQRLNEHADIRSVLATLVSGKNVMVLPCGVTLEFVEPQPGEPSDDEVERRLHRLIVGDGTAEDDSDELFEPSPLAQEQLKRLRAMSPADRQHFLREFNGADGKAFAQQVADEERFQAMLDKFETIALLPPSLAGLRVVSSGMPVSPELTHIVGNHGPDDRVPGVLCEEVLAGGTLKYDTVPLSIGDKQIGWARDVVVTFDKRGPRTEIGSFDLKCEGSVVANEFRWRSPVLAESPEQRERRQARNRRKAARRNGRR
jgi:hypothetical protein